MKKTIRKRNVLFFSIVSFFICTSCVSRKDIIYFQNDQIEQQKVSNVYNTVFKPDDLLQITISAENLEAVKDFNLPAVAFSATNSSVIGQPQQLSYLIDSKGEIDFPVLGALKIGGLTREETITLLKDKLSPAYVTNPLINIRIANYKVTVTGDVGRPGTFNIPNERVSILDAIGLAGDLNISGKRENVLVIREEGAEKKEYRVNLLSKKMYTSPVFYLQQNDIVYVEPNYAAIQSASFNRNTGLFISIGSILISLMAVLTR